MGCSSNGENLLMCDRHHHFLNHKRCLCECQVTFYELAQRHEKEKNTDTEYC